MPRQIPRHAARLAPRSIIIRQIQAELVLDADTSFDVQEIDRHDPSTGTGLPRFAAVSGLVDVGLTRQANRELAFMQI